ncbi:DNA-processing protein DprA [Thermovibrio ammonificans]
MTREELLALALHLKRGFGYAAYRRLVEKFGSLESAVKLGAVELSAELSAAEGEVEKAEKLGVRILTVASPGYPEELLQVASPPLALYLRGELPSGPRVAVIGSRRCSPYGRRIAFRLGKLLSEAGVTVVSGLAQGIDTEAHRGAVRGGGLTLAVLGSGVDRVFPLTNLHLAEEIVESGGGLLSEFPLGTKARKEFFPRRNRIVSGLSSAVVVVEATERSGTFITVDYALEQGREVFAVPGPIDSPYSRGTNRLLKEGAVPLTELSELLEFLGVKGAEVRVPPEFERAYSLLSAPLTADAFAVKLGVQIHEALRLLAQMELLGLVSREGGLYRAC